MFAKLSWPILDLKQFIEDDTKYNCILQDDITQIKGVKTALIKMTINEKLVLVSYINSYDNNGLIYCNSYQHNYREFICYDKDSKLIIDITSPGEKDLDTIFRNIKKDFRIINCSKAFKELELTYSKKLECAFDEYFSDKVSNLKLFDKYSSRISTDHVLSDIKFKYILNFLNNKLDYKFRKDTREDIINLVHLSYTKSDYLDKLVKNVFEDNINEIDTFELVEYVNFKMLNRALEDKNNSINSEIKLLKNIYEATIRAGKTITIVDKKGNTFKARNQLDLNDGTFPLVRNSSTYPYSYLPIHEIESIKFNRKTIYSCDVA